MLKFEWCQKHKKEILLICVSVSVLLVLQWWSQYQAANSYIKDDNHVIGIQRKNTDDEEAFPLLLEMEKNGKRYTYKVTITLQGKAGDESKKALEENTEDGIQEKIDSLVEAIQSEKDDHIELPTALTDGTPIFWNQQKETDSLLILLLPPCLIYFLYRSEKEKEVKRRKQFERVVRKSLPNFNDQLLLLLNCGLIFHDAFYRIGRSYEKRREIDAFGQLLCEVMRDTKDGGQSIATALRSKAQSVGIREFSRAVSIICDNQNTGVDFKEKLESESVRLWEERKLLAMERGKEVETRLTLPLVLLLLVLIMITGVPAMMNM